ncbi:hypothetical protein QQ045_000539 [Rhodiola kirilowii]
MMNKDNNDPFGKQAYDTYHRLVTEAQTPIYSGSDITVLEAILKAMQKKVANRWSDKSFNNHLRLCKEILRRENNFPSCYRDVKSLLKNLGLGYELYMHASMVVCCSTKNIKIFKIVLCVMKRHMAMIHIPKLQRRWLNTFL